MLSQFREKLDCIDKEIAELIIQRLDISKQIGTEKKHNGWSAPTDKTREEAVIANVCAYASDSQYKETLKNIYEVIISEGKKYQDRIINE